MGFGDLAGSLSSLAGGVIGNIAAGGDQDQATQDMENALSAIKDVNAPTVDEMKVALQKYQSAGTITPALEQAIQANPSAFNGISLDPRLKQAQMQALKSLQDRSNMGLSASDRQALDEERLQTSGQAQAQNAAILQNMAQRGMAGSGAELAAKLSASQNASNQAAQAGDRTAAMAQQNALNAISQAGSLGGQIRSQDYAQASDKAKANDYINMFNTQNAQSVGNQNTSIANNAQQYNLNNKQNIMNANTGVGNQQEMHNKGLYQTVFGDQMQRAGALAGQYNKNSNYYGDQAAQTRGMWSGIGDSVGQMAESGNPFAGSSGGTMGPNQGPQLPSYGTMGPNQGPQLPQMAGMAATFMSEGGMVPGEPNVSGDSPVNDNKLIVASPGEIMLPRSVVNDPVKALDFIENAKKQAAPDMGPGDHKHLFKAIAKLHKRVGQLESKK